MLTLERINELPSTQCRCESCIRMCTESRPCWGTPAEMSRLIDKGYAPRLMLDHDIIFGPKDTQVLLVVPALMGYEGKEAPTDPIGRCNLLDASGNCCIQEMKPTEGRVTDHHRYPWYMELHESLVEIWNTPEGRGVVARWEREIGIE